VLKAIRRYAASVTRAREPAYADLEKEFLNEYARCSQFTMTSIERMYALYRSVKYVVESQIPGAVVECGVWRGGSMMLAARTLLLAGVDDRELYLFDTYKGMSQPTERDVSWTGAPAEQRWREQQRGDVNEWAFASVEEVKRNLAGTGYPMERVNLVEGRVEETIPVNAAERIALLRLDTDWYDSTYHELVHLFPRLERGGVLIVDDYGHWKGAREAVDQYFAETRSPMLLNRIDYTGRVGVKT
jgi:O-methyltransferase